MQLAMHTGVNSCKEHQALRTCCTVITSLCCVQDAIVLHLLNLEMLCFTLAGQQIGKTQSQTALYYVKELTFYSVCGFLLPVCVTMLMNQGG